MATPEIDLRNFRLVAQSLNYYATPGPLMGITLNKSQQSLKSLYLRSALYMLMQTAVMLNTYGMVRVLAER